MKANYSPIEEQEVASLAKIYGQPQTRIIAVEGDEYLFATRLYRTQDRRGEVVMAVERPDGRLLLHHKGWYEPGVFRLLSGGIGWRETVDEALRRELYEETGLIPRITRFLGVLQCRIRFASDELSFVSYVLHLELTEGTLRLPQTEDISKFREIFLGELPGVADKLRRVPAPRAAWGNWRAIAHDFVHEMLSAREESRAPAPVVVGNSTEDQL